MTQAAKDKKTGMVVAQVRRERSKLNQGRPMSAARLSLYLPTTPSTQRHLVKNLDVAVTNAFDYGEEVVILRKASYDAMVGKGGARVPAKKAVDNG